MRIAYDHQIFTFQSVGGISRYFATLADTLASSGNQIAIFSGLHQNQHLAECSTASNYGLRLPFVKKRGVRIRGRINKLYSRCVFPLWKPDIIHQTFYQALPFYYVAPVIITVYDMIYEIVPQFDPSSHLSSADKRNAVSVADHVICISENTKRDLVRLFGTSPDKISVVPLAADFPDVKTLPYSNEGRPYILIVGSRAGIKNFPVLLESLAKSDILQHCALIAFGGGPFTPSEQQKMQSLGIQQSSVKQIKGDDALLASLYKGARFFIYPSIYEGFGLPPLEAMASGCPVASSNTSSMPEVLGDAAAYFNPNVPSEIAAVMTDLFHNSAIREELVRAGLARAAHYSWERTAKMTLEVYEQVLSNHK